MEDKPKQTTVRITREARDKAAKIALSMSAKDGKLVSIGKAVEAAIELASKQDK